MVYAIHSNRDISTNLLQNVMCKLDLFRHCIFICVCVTLFLKITFLIVRPGRKRSPSSYMAGLLDFTWQLL